MSAPELVHHYGYIAVFAGALMQSQTVLLSAGLAAAAGYLSPGPLGLVALVGGVAGDQLYFYLGHHHGRALLRRFPSLATRVARAQALLRRHHEPLVLVNRFLYGLRLIGPLAMGMSGLRWRRYALFDLLGALLWVTVFAGAGYFFGSGVELLLRRLDGYEEPALGAALAALLLLWLGWRLRGHQATRDPGV